MFSLLLKDLISDFIFPYSMCANSEGSGDTARMRRLASAFADRLCDKYPNLMGWPKSQSVDIQVDGQHSYRRPFTHVAKRSSSIGCASACYAQGRGFDPNGPFHPCMLDESICHLRDAWCSFSIFRLFKQNVLHANSVYTDQTTRSVE